MLFLHLTYESNHEASSDPNNGKRELKRNCKLFWRWYVVNNVSSDQQPHQKCYPQISLQATELLPVECDDSLQQAHVVQLAEAQEECNGLVGHSPQDLLPLPALLVAG